jgi:hypothetical protein
VLHFLSFFFSFVSLLFFSAVLDLIGPMFCFLIPVAARFDKDS